jgi:acetyltransferase-like isoleucine patch superfamily enzyme
VRGRTWFRLLRPLLRALELPLRLLPRRWAGGGLALFRHVPGKLGIGLRYLFARRLFAACGDVVAIFEGVYIRNGQGIRCGSHVSIHPLCYLDGIGGITLGNDVSIAHGVSILSFDHGFADPSLPIRNNPTHKAEVRLGDDVWIGCGARLLAGVEIGSRSVVGAGAVVTRSIPAGRLALGVPARTVKEIPGAPP